MMKKSRIEIIGTRLLVISAMVAIIGYLGVKSVESDTNVEVQKVQDRITELSNEIDGLNIVRQEATAFAYLNQVATSKGYTYTRTDATAYVFGE